MKPRNEGSAWEGKSWEGRSWVDRFPDATRRHRRVNVDHGPDNLDFGKQLFWDAVLLGLVTLVCVLGIGLTLYYSANGGW